jgi:acetyltransferase-like isoleucine patch superfamily enzyme
MKRLVRRLLLVIVRWLGLPGEAVLTGRYAVLGDSLVFPGRHRHLVDVHSTTALHGALFNAWEPIVLEEGVVLGHQVAFLTGDHRQVGGVTDKSASSRGGIVVRRGAWVASRAVVLGGVEIGEGAVVAAGAVVTTDVPARQMWAGAPARRVKDL